MTLLSRYDGPVQPPEPLAPVAGHLRRIRLTHALNLPSICGELHSIHDVDPVTAIDLISGDVAVYHEDDLPQSRPGPALDGDGEEMEPPKPYASKGDWVRWAVANGCAEEVAGDMTKAQLQNDYGERL